MIDSEINRINRIRAELNKLSLVYGRDKVDQELLIEANKVLYNIVKHDVAKKIKKMKIYNEELRKAFEDIKEE